MKCINCGAEISEGAKFCIECGQKIAAHPVKCPSCGTLVSGGNFCPECGASLNEGASMGKYAANSRALNDSDNDKFTERGKKLKTARAYAFREMYLEAKALYDELLKDDPEDVDVYMGYIRIATKNYTDYEDEDGEIGKLIRLAQRVSGKEDLSKFDQGYEAFIDGGGWIYTEKTDAEADLAKFSEENVVENSVLIAYKGAGGDVVIPEGITEIGEMAFRECTSLVSLKLAESVTKIDKFAFRDCSSLEVLKISANFCTLELSAFSRCKSLKTIYVHPGNKYFKCLNGALYSRDGKTLLKYPAGKTAEVFAIPDGVEEIDNFAIAECDTLVRVIIPNGVYSIGELAFCNCPQLKDVYLPDSVTVIKEEAFSGCASLAYANVPSGVHTIGDGAYSDCRSLVNIYVDSSNANFKSVDGVLYTKDGKTLLRYPTGKLNKNIKIPAGVTKISDHAFDYSRSIESVTIPEGVTEIGDSAFSWCKALKDVNIPESVTSIGRWAFLDCNSLKKVIIPHGVRSIGYRAFACCEALTIYLRRSRTNKLGESWADDGPKVVWNYKGEI